jgi:hypothetical protein
MPERTKMKKIQMSVTTPNVVNAILQLSGYNGIMWHGKGSYTSI